MIIIITVRLAMLADAAHECLALVRFFDTDDYDVAATPARIELCCKRVSFTSVSWNLLTSIFHGNHIKPIYIHLALTLVTVMCT